MLKDCRRLIWCRPISPFADPIPFQQDRQCGQQTVYWRLRARGLARDIVQLERKEHSINRLFVARHFAGLFPVVGA
jgi:hypothetical protein